MATSSVPIPEAPNNTAVAIADAILALFNSQPRTPTRDAIVATILAVLTDRHTTSLHRSGRFWNVEATGDWGKDCEVGEEQAKAYLKQWRSGNAPLLCWVIRDMIKAGRWSGVECAFVSKLIHLLAEEAMAGRFRSVRSDRQA